MTRNILTVVVIVFAILSSTVSTTALTTAALPAPDDAPTIAGACSSSTACRAYCENNCAEVVYSFVSQGANDHPSCTCVCRPNPIYRWAWGINVGVFSAVCRAD